MHEHGANIGGVLLNPIELLENDINNSTVSCLTHNSHGAFIHRNSELKCNYTELCACMVINERSVYK